MKKKLLFVINTLGRAGAEMAMLELMRRLPEEQYEISLYVILGQGELVRELPGHVKVLNRSYRDTSVLSERGRRHIQKTVIRSFFRNGRWIRKLYYLLAVALEMRKRKKIQLDKLLWRMLSDGGEFPREEYDLAIAYLEGGATYFTADHVKAKKKAAFVHIDYENAGYTRRMDRGCYASFDRIFAVSEEVQTSFLQVYPEWETKTHVFHNIINRERISRLAGLPGGFSDSFAGVRHVGMCWGKAISGKLWKNRLRAWVWSESLNCWEQWKTLIRIIGNVIFMYTLPVLRARALQFRKRRFWDVPLWHPTVMGTENR